LKQRKETTRSRRRELFSKDIALWVVKLGYKISIKRSSFTPFVLAHSSFINRGRFRSKNKKMPVQVPSGPTSGATTIGGPVAQGNNGIERSRSLWVGELSFDTDEATLVNVFQQIGPLESVRICKDGKSKKYCSSLFTSYFFAKIALKYKNQVFGLRIR